MKNNQDENLTSKEMYEETRAEYLHLTTKSLIESNNQLKISENNVEIITNLYQQLKTAFLCGQAEAAYYLSEFYYNGWLINKYNITNEPNEERTNFIEKLKVFEGDLIIAIGKNAGASNCTYVNYRGNKLLPSKNLPSKYQNLVRTCAEVIKNNKLTFKGVIDKDIKRITEFRINEKIKDTSIKNIFNPEVPLASFPSPVILLDDEQYEPLLTNQNESDRTYFDNDNKSKLTLNIQSTPLLNNITIPDQNNLASPSSPTILSARNKSAEPTHSSNETDKIDYDVIIDTQQNPIPLSTEIDKTVSVNENPSSVLSESSKNLSNTGEITLTSSNASDSNNKSSSSSRSNNDNGGELHQQITLLNEVVNTQPTDIKLEANNDGINKQILSTQSTILLSEVHKIKSTDKLKLSSFSSPDILEKNDVEIESSKLSGESGKSQGCHCEIL